MGGSWEPDWTFHSANAMDILSQKDHRRFELPPKESLLLLGAGTADAGGSDIKVVTK